MRTSAISIRRVKAREAGDRVRSHRSAARGVQEADEDPDADGLGRQRRQVGQLLREPQTVEAVRRDVNKYGGKAQVLMLPEAGLKGNTHIPFADMNNVAVADLLEVPRRERSGQALEHTLLRTPIGRFLMCAVIATSFPLAAPPAKPPPAHAAARGGGLGDGEGYALCSSLIPARSTDVTSLDSYSSFRWLPVSSSAPPTRQKGGRRWPAFFWGG